MSYLQSLWYRWLLKRLRQELRAVLDFDTRLRDEPGKTSRGTAIAMDRNTIDALELQIEITRLEEKLGILPEVNHDHRQS
jgi:hypothetical protein